MEANVIIKDKTHDPFIIFGGLFSRKLVSQELNGNSVEDKQIFERAKELKDFILNNKISEERLRQKIATTLLYGLSPNLPPHSRGDIFFQNVVVEVKNSPEELDVEIIKGSLKIKSSNRIETAVEELFRYLLGKSPKDWGILTTGRIYRFYHRSNEDQYIEFDLFDIVDSGSLNHLYLLRQLLSNPAYRDELLAKTKETRNIQSRETLFKQFSKLLSVDENLKRGQAYPKLISYLSLLSLRYLEDTGCLPVLSPEYQKYSLKKEDNFTKENLVKILDKFLSGTWHNSKRQTLLSDEELRIIHKTWDNKSFVKSLKEIFCSQSSFDYSDIFLDQLGGVYQEVVNKNSEGAYYTPYSIGRKIAGYLKGINEKQKIDFEANSKKVIVDIACGSGQLLRALVPYSHLFFKDSKEFLGKNSVRRKMIARLVGVDKDPNSVFICKLSLALFGAEEGLGLSMPRLMKEEDTLEAFIDSRSNFIEIDRKDIFSIVTNPPWEALEFNVTGLYRKVTGNPLPKKSNKSEEAARQNKVFDKWVKDNKAIIDEEEQRIESARQLCDRVAAEHKEYFSGKKNTALYFLFIVQKIIEQSGGSYVVVMPDRFFVGDMNPLRDLSFHQFDGYIPFQNCGAIFDGVDNGTRFGIIFGRHKKDKSMGDFYLQIPVMENLIPVDFISKKISKQDFMISENETILPFFRNAEEVDLMSAWLSNRNRLTSWSRGKINLGDRKSYAEYANSVGGKDKYKYRITKSETRNTKGTKELSGSFDVPFGASIKEIDEKLVAHYKEDKFIIPNVKSNGVRKVLVGRVNNCLVETDYNYNSELNKSYGNILKSFIYNAIVNCMCGSYHLNASLLNQIGVPSITLDSLNGFELEIELLKAMGVSEADALNIIFKSVLTEYPSEIKAIAIRELSSKYNESFRHLDLSFDPDYSAILSQSEFFSGDKPKVFDLETTSKLAGYIVANLKNDKNFGRVKFAKTLYLTQHLCEIDLGLDWKRQAAGPYNEKDLKLVESTLKSDLGIVADTKMVEGKKYIKYKVDGNIQTNELIEEFDTSKKRKIKDWVQWFKPFSTEKMELIATVFAAWNDMLLKGESVTMRKIIEEVRENWAPSKIKFSEQRIRQEVEFMKQNDLVPKGFGYPTLS